MKKIAAIAAVPLLIGFLYAQQSRTTETRTTTKTTTWNGVLVDAGCRTTDMEHHETINNPGERSSRSDSSHTVDCPVTTSTTSFGLLTPDGQFIRFDPSSNTRVVEIVKGNHALTEDMTERRPISVRVVGAPNGNTVMVESVTPVAVQGEASRVITAEPGGTTVVETETMLDADYNGDHGKLLIAPDRITWQDLSHTNRSHSWTYSEIKELKRDRGDNAVKIEAYGGGDHKFKIRGPFMSDAVYDMIAERIVAAHH